MRRLARRLFTLCSAVSLVLCVAVCVLWVRSLFVGDLLRYSTESAAGGRSVTEWHVFSNGGCLQITRTDTVRLDALPINTRPGLGWSFGPLEYSAPMGWAGFVKGLGRFGFESGTEVHPRITLHWKAVELPDWLLLLVFSIPAQLAFVRMLPWRARGRTGERLSGRCPSCGYDLRASPGRCPECGAAEIPN